MSSRTAVSFGVSTLVFVAGCQAPPNEVPEPAPAPDRDPTVVAAAPGPVAPSRQRPAWLDQLLAPAAEADHADEVEDAPDVVETPPSRHLRRPEAERPASVGRITRQTDARPDAAGPDRTTPVASAAPAPAPTGNTVAVAAFANLNEQAATADLGSSLARAVAERLAAVDGLTIAGAADEARFAIGGSIQQIGSMVRVTARISETDDGSVLRAVKVDGSVHALGQLSEEVIAAVSASVEAVTATRDGAVASVATNVLAVLPFDDLGQQRSAVDLGTAIANAVAEQLDDLAGVSVVSTSSVEDANWVVDGGIQRVGDAARVTARLLDVESGAVLARVKVDGTTGDLADLQDRVGSTIAESVLAALEGSASADAAR